MRQRVTFFMTEEEHAALAAHAAKTGLSMSRVIGKAVRAVTSGTIEVSDECVIVKQGVSDQHTFRMLKPQTPTNVSRETPVPDVPVDTTEYVLNELGQRHPEGSIMRITEDDNGFLHDMGYTPWKPLGKAKK